MTVSWTRTGIAAALLLAGCHAAARDEAGEEPSNFAPPTADATPAPIRVIDNSVIRDLARGTTAGVVLFDVRRVPAAVRPQVAAERAEDAACRQGGSDAPSACARRDAMAAELRRLHWCWGPDAEVEADRRWMRQGTGCRG